MTLFHIPTTKAFTSIKFITQAKITKHATHTLPPIINVIINGKPVILINPKGIDYKSMQKLNLATDDILAALREQGYFSISQVQYAIMETNGKVSVMPKAEFAPVTNGEMKLNQKSNFLPIVLISEGRIIKENVVLAGLRENDILALVYKQTGAKSIKEILILTLDKMGQGYIQTLKSAGKTFQSKRLA